MLRITPSATPNVTHFSPSSASCPRGHGAAQPDAADILRAVYDHPRLPARSRRGRGSRRRIPSLARRYISVSTVVGRTELHGQQAVELEINVPPQRSPAPCDSGATSPAVRIGGDQGDAGQAAGGQVPEEPQPPRAVLGRGDLVALHVCATPINWAGQYTTLPDATAGVVRRHGSSIGSSHTERHSTVCHLVKARPMSYGSPSRPIHGTASTWGTVAGCAAH